MTVKVRDRSSSGLFNRKKEIESKRAIKNRHIYRSSFFYYIPSPIFLFLSITICPSTYLPVQLCLCLSLSLSFLAPALSLAFRTFASSLNQGAQRARAHTCTRIHVRICEKMPHPRVYITRRDPSLVRSHFKHLLYHDRSLARSVLLSRCERFLLAVPRARRKDVRSSERDFDGPSTRIKDPFAMLYLRLAPLASSCLSFLRMRYARRWANERLKSCRKYDESFRILVTDRNPWKA